MTDSEELSEVEYHERYNRVGDHLRNAAHRLKSGLLPRDVTGLLCAVGIEFLREHEPDKNVVAWLRDLADALEKGEIGIKPKVLN